MVGRTPSSSSQAWLLVELAHVLRRRGRHAEALGVLDLAVGLNAAPASELAAYVCAVAAHLAAGDEATARKVSATARARAVEPGLLASLGELYLGLFRETGEAAHLDEAFTCLELAQLDGLTKGGAPKGPP